MKNNTQNDNAHRPSSPTEVDGTQSGLAATVTFTGVGCNALLGSVLFQDLRSEGIISAQSMNRLSKDPMHPISKLQYPPDHPALDSLVRVHPRKTQ